MMAGSEPVTEPRPNQEMHASRRTRAVAMVIHKRRLRDFRRYFKRQRGPQLNRIAFVLLLVSGLSVHFGCKKAADFPIFLIASLA